MTYLTSHPALVRIVSSAPQRSIALLFHILFLIVSVASGAAFSLEQENPLVQADGGQLNTAVLTSSVAGIEFGRVVIGGAEKRRFVLTNSGLNKSQSITLFSIYLNEPDALVFSTDFVGPVELPAGESYAVEVTYSPQESGESIGALFISHSGASNLEVFTLTGESASLPLLAMRAAPKSDVISFGKSTLKNTGNIKPTSLQFGPDDRLYVADMLGVIKVYDVTRNTQNNYSVIHSESITAVRDIPNHDDDGQPNASINKRLVTGIVVVGTPTTPIIYVASSDPRIGGGPSHTDTNLDTNSGVISRLTRQGDQWVKLDLVRGLPRSEENHHGNGMVLNPVSNMLYLAIGGNTNQGAASSNFANLSEYALSAAILEIDLDQIGNSTYNIPTLNDEDRAGVSDQYDPFGGNDGKNQAKLVPNGPVQVYAPGFRNPYDIVLTQNGRLYSIDNGPNAGWGATPIGEGPTGNCTNGTREPGQTFFDALHYITGRGYYAGHANPTRGNKQNTFNASNPQSPVSLSNSIECDYRGAGPANNALTTINTSTNGLVEYTASNFNGAMQGDLLAAAFSNKIYRFKLNQAGTIVVKKTALFSNVGGIPLDVTAQADDQKFAGTIWAADFVKKSIIVFEPSDYAGQVTSGCSGNVAHADDDGDGFSNSDEISNGTNPCSSADMPNDYDGDKISDLTDQDDDNDGLVDSLDPFALDPANGRNTSLPLSYTWENNSAPAGYLLNLGFSGLMNNGVTDYSDLYDLGQLTAGGAAGVFTIDNIPGTDPIGARNDQAYAFQLGLNVNPQSPPFTVRTRIIAPFSGIAGKPHQSMGLYIGTGDQDNYVKLVVNSLGSGGGIQFAVEMDGKFQSVQQLSTAVFEVDAIDLFLNIDPATGTVTPSYQTKQSASTGDRIALGTTVSIPTAWFTANTGLAIGIISTSVAATPFTATWDFIEAYPEQISGGGSTGGGSTGGGSTDRQEEVRQEEVRQEEARQVEARQVTGGGSTGGGSTGGDSSAGGFLEISGKVVIESEHYNGNTAAGVHQWVAGNKPGASGGDSMLSTPNNGTLRAAKAGSPMLSYPVEFSATGVYHVWVRGWGDTNAQGEGRSDSVHVGIDGNLSTATAMDYFPNRWHWSKSKRGAGTASITVSSIGTHTINVWMREDGLHIDKLVLAKIGSYNPTGTGPDETRSGSTGGGSTGGGSTDGGSTDGGSTDGGSTDGGSTDGGSTDGGSTDGGSTGGGSTGGGSTGGGSTGGGSTGGGSTGGDSSAGGFREINGKVVIESEHYDGNIVAGVHQWVAGNKPGASGSGSMLSTPNNGTLKPGKAGSPMLSYPVEFSSTGVYHVWVRGWGDTNAQGEGRSDSVHVGIDGDLSTATAMDYFPNRWHWSKSKRGAGTASITVSSTGTHTINVWMREDGLHIDKLVLAKIGSYSPTGTGPDETGSGSTGDGSTGDGSTDGGSTDGTGGATNQAPVITMSTHATALVGDVLDITAVISDDGLPGGVLHTNWSQIAGPSTVVFGELSSLSTSVTFSAPGGYLIKLNVNDGAISSSAIMSIVVSAGEGAGGDGDSSGDVTGSVSGTTPWVLQQSGNGSKPVARHEAGMVSMNGKLYLMGGRGSRAISVYDPTNKTWTNKAAPPFEMHHFQPVVWGGKIYVVGAMTCCYPTETTVANIYTYTPATNLWAKAGAIPASRLRGSAGSVVYNNKIYLIGGNTKGHSGGMVSWFDEYDPQTDEWRTLPSAPTKRDHMQVAVANDKLVVAAGRQTSYPKTFDNVVSVVDVFDFNSRTWSRVANIPNPRAGTMTVNVGDEVIVMGGETKGFSLARNKVEAFNVNTGQWRALQPLTQGRHGGGAAVLGSAIHVVSGNTRIGGGYESSSHETVQITP